MEARLRLPPKLTAQAVQAALEEISAEIMVDISLTPAVEAGTKVSAGRDSRA
jgi:glycine cleavage system regulatory protein